MSLRFQYFQITRVRPVIVLGGRTSRPRPIVPITALGPTGSWALDALVDPGSDDTVFPERVAHLIGVDLTNAPQGIAGGVGGSTGRLRYAQVTLRIADSREQREWQAWVGFTAMKLRYPMLGFAGFLQYFTASFFGDLEEVELAINSAYAGT